MVDPYFHHSQLATWKVVEKYCGTSIALIYDSPLFFLLVSFWVFVVVVIIIVVVVVVIIYLLFFYN